ncbi:MAG: DUF1501 domain-containing protein [Terriglobia bacterium]
MNRYSCHRYTPAKSRRDFLALSSFGFGAVALNYLLDPMTVLGSTNLPIQNSPLAPKSPHFPSKAKSVIFIFLQGGPSQVDTFDPKPELAKLDGQLLPPSFRNGMLGLAQIKAEEAKLMGSRRTFKKYGSSGLEISDLFENLANYADDLAVIRSCYHESFVHGPALGIIHTGTNRLGHPSMGAWVLYGLGSETQDLPSYIVMADSFMRNGKAVIGSGFLPALYQATVVSTEGVPLENLSPPEQIDTQSQITILEQLKEWNQRHLEERSDDTALAARISNFELAFRMQTQGPELIDISKEPASVRKMYGMDTEPTAKFGRICLLARRMVERGVRFVHLYNSDWDGHAENDRLHRTNAAKTDLPIAGLIGDLKQRGLLESTLVVCVGEFGRTPMMQGKEGRDHNPYGFTAWMAGGGIQGGKVIGATDEIGFRAVQDRVHANDLHASMLTLLGLDHKKLNVQISGLEKRLTGVGSDGEFGVEVAKRLVQS